MVTSNTRDGTLDLPEPFVRAIVQHAERLACLTAACLKSIEFFQTKPIRLSEAFLLELAAMIELVFWERWDLCRQLPVDLPTSREAADQLMDRCKKGATAFEDPNDTPLHHRMLRVWREHFAWDAWQHLETEILIGEVDEDEIVDVMANFLWENRHELSQLLREEEQL